MQDEDGRPPIKMSAADQLARMALGTMEQECGHGIGDAAMGPFVDTHGSILLARRKLDAATRQVLKFILYLRLFSLAYRISHGVFLFLLLQLLERYLAISLRHDGPDSLPAMKANDKLGTFYFLLGTTSRNISQCQTNLLALRPSPTNP